MENVKLDLIPGRVMPICHASQYDVGRVIRFNLVENDVPYVLDGTETVTFGERKIDGNVVTAACVVTATKSYVDLETTEQMCACYGQNLCELKIEKGSDIIGTLNFVLDVERDPLDGGIQSQSEIYNLQVQIDEIIQQELENYDIYGAYVTEQTSGAVANFTDGADNVPVKALSVEFAATQAEGTPTPSAPIPIVGVDKVNVTDCGINVCDEVFEVGDIDATTGQNAGGTSTIRTKNYIPIKPDTQYYTYISGSGTATLRTRFYDINKNYIGSTQKNGSPVGYNARFTTPENAYYLRFTPQTAYGTTYNNDISINYPATDTEYHAYTGGATALINLGGTYYGGSVDAVTGKITLTKEVRVFDGDIPLGDFGLTVGEVYTQFSYIPYMTIGLGNEILMSDKFERVPVSQSNRLYKIYNNGTTTAPRLFLGLPPTVTTKAEAVAWFASNPTTVVFELATPIVVYASNTAEIPTILGVNNIFSDAGDVDVTYRADTALYIDKRLNA